MTRRSGADWLELHSLLMAAYGPRGWWPLVPPEGGAPRYRSGMWRERRSTDEVFEIGAGAVLTQRVAWRNAVVAVANLGARGALSARGLLALPDADLEAAVRSTGTWRRKAATLRRFAHWFLAAWRPNGRGPNDPDSMGSISGFGPETTDSVLLYGLGVPRFVADAYARRILVRTGIVAAAPSYEAVRREMESRYPLTRELCDEGHALLVELGKRHCRTRPLCSGCPLEARCAYARARPATSSPTAPSPPSRETRRATGAARGRRTAARTRA